MEDRRAGRRPTAWKHKSGTAGALPAPPGSGGARDTTGGLGLSLPLLLALLGAGVIVLLVVSGAQLSRTGTGAATTGFPRAGTGDVGWPVTGELVIAQEAMGALLSITACSTLGTKSIDDPGRDMVIGLAAQCSSCDQTQPEKCAFPTFQDDAHQDIKELAHNEDSLRYLQHAEVCEAVYGSRKHDVDAPGVRLDEFASIRLARWPRVGQFHSAMTVLSMPSTHRIHDVADMDKPDECDAVIPAFKDVERHWPDYVAAGGLDVFKPLDACSGPAQRAWCAPLREAAASAVSGEAAFSAFETCRGLQSASLHAHVRLKWPGVFFDDSRPGGVAGAGVGALEGEVAQVLARRASPSGRAPSELLAALDEQSRGCADKLLEGQAASLGGDGQALRAQAGSTASACAAQVPTDADLVDGFLASAFAWELMNDIRMAGPHETRLGFDSRSVSGLSSLWIAAYSNRMAPSRAAYHSSRIPVRFPLACPPNPEYASEIPFLEPLEPTVRNLVFAELQGALAAFPPYRILPTLPSVRSRTYRERVLIDIGANGFFRSGKYLTDMYEPLFPFDRVVIVDPHPMEVSNGYGKRYNMSNLLTIVTIGMEEPESDLATLVARAGITRDDFVVLKFDVDEAIAGPTMEWGFVKQLMVSQLRWLVDELFVELHFKFISDSMGWQHDRHSMLEAFDTFRELRECGVAVHSWP